MELNRIEQLIAKTSLTSEEKKEIKKAAEEAGIEYTIKKGRFCRECYEKILLKLYEASKPEANKSVDSYKLKDVRKDIIIGGVRVNNANIASVEVGRFSQSVINSFFELCE